MGVRPALHQILIDGKPKLTYKPKKSVGRVNKFTNYTVHSGVLFPKPGVHEVIDGEIILKNTTPDPVMIKKHEQVCIVQVLVCDEDIQSSLSSPPTPQASPVASVCKSKISPDGEYSSSPPLSVTMMNSSIRSSLYTSLYISIMAYLHRHISFLIFTIIS